MSAANGDGGVPAEFIPGIASAGQLSGGSTASRTPPPDAQPPPGSVSGTPSAQPVALRDQAVSGRRASTSQPGQVDGSAISPGDASDYGDSGAGQGRTFADQHRYPWQAQPGGR